MAEAIARRLLAGLTPPPETVEPACDATEIAEATAALGEDAVRWAIALGRTAFDAVLREIRAEHPPEFYLRLSRAIERSAVDLLRLLAGATAEFTLNPDQLAVVGSAARDELPFENTVHGLRIIQRSWTRTFLDLAETHRPARERIPVLRAVTEVVTSFFDQTVDAVVSEYLAERQRLLAQRRGDQRHLVSVILAGQHADPAAARTLLGVDLARHHLAFLVWLDDSSNEHLTAQSPERPPEQSGGQGYLEQVAQDVARALGCGDPFVAGLDGGALPAWASRPRPFTDADTAAVRALEPAGVRIALGQPEPGAVGFRRSHLAAQDARRIAKWTPTARVVVYAEVALVALLGNDLERVRWFVGEQLGPLAGDAPATAELRRTLLTFFDLGGSLVKTAAALHVHRNTVVYRLQRVERILGRRPAERPLETHAALRLAALGRENPQS